MFLSILGLSLLYQRAHEQIYIISACQRHCYLWHTAALLPAVPHCMGQLGGKRSGLSQCELLSVLLLLNSGIFEWFRPLTIRLRLHKSRISFWICIIAIAKKNWHRIAHTLAQSCPFAVNPNLLYLVQSKLCNAAVPVGTAVFHL